MATALCMVSMSLYGEISIFMHNSAAHFFPKKNKKRKDGMIVLIRVIGTLANKNG